MCTYSTRLLSAGLKYALFPGQKGTLGMSLELRPADTTVLLNLYIPSLVPNFNYTRSGSKLNITAQFIEDASPSDSTQQMLQCVTAERDRLKKEKEEEVATLNGKLHAMEKSYEAVLQVCVVIGGTVQPSFI